jgi:outer membrane protein TolC
VEATRQDLHAAAITLAADVTRTWLRRIEQRRQLALLDEQIATNEKVLEVITLRFRRGQVPATDVLQQRELVEQRRGERTLVRGRIAVLDHQLAVLVGAAPGTLEAEAPAPLPARPPLPQAGVPAELVRRRPDVRAAELRVQAEDQRVWAALTDQFPRVALSATASTTAAEARDLFDNWLASIAANLTAPLFDAGLRRAEVERTKAVLRERLHAYGQAVLVSLGEVEDALAQEAQQAAYVGSLRAQLDLSRRSAEQTREQYIKGTADFTRYLTTRLSYQGLQRTLLQARRDLLLLRVDLYRALAGGWDLSRPGEASGSAVADSPGPGESGSAEGGSATDG